MTILQRCKIEIVGDYGCNNVFEMMLTSEERETLIKVENRSKEVSSEHGCLPILRITKMEHVDDELKRPGQ
jgi:hypothetical protein